MLALTLLIECSNLLVGEKQLRRNYGSTVAACLVLPTVNERLTFWALEFHVCDAA